MQIFCLDHIIDSHSSLFSLAEVHVQVGQTEMSHSLEASAAFLKSGLGAPSLWFLYSMPHCVVSACLLGCILWHTKLSKDQILGLFYSLPYPQYLA